jgi:hypothetical protein
MIDLGDEENRRVLASWAAELRASFTFDHPIALPRAPDAALAKLRRACDQASAQVDAAVATYARTKKWPETLSVDESFFIWLRIWGAARVVDGLRSGSIARLDIAEEIFGDNPNFTEWMLTVWWETHREFTLEWYAEAQADLD